MTSQVTKRAFDLVMAASGLVLLSPLLAVAAMASWLSTGEPPLFRQTRIGRDGRPFTVLKLRTMRTIEGHDATVTVRGDARVTRVGAMLRQSKIDELPQLVNVVRGDMSLVGPRPDVPGQADALTGADRVVLTVRPGITSPAAVLLRDEEALLAAAKDPEEFNAEVLYRYKTILNVEYVARRTFVGDIRCIAQTLFPWLWGDALRSAADEVHRSLLDQAGHGRSGRDRA